MAPKPNFSASVAANGNFFAQSGKRTGAARVCDEGHIRDFISYTLKTMVYTMLKTVV